jgi:uncharacterized membrane protein YoaT (DUF817 family)
MGDSTWLLTYLFCGQFIYINRFSGHYMINSRHMMLITNMLLSNNIMVSRLPPESYSPFTTRTGTPQTT